MFLNTYEAAATLTVGTDALRNERLNSTSKNRVMRAIGIVGANAINECEAAVYIEDFFVGNFRNTRSGAVQILADQDMIPVGPFAVPAGSKVVALITVAPTVSPLIIRIQ